jgi:hypothetical protein
MTTPARERVLKTPVLGSLVRWVLALIRLRATITSLTARIDDVTRQGGAVQRRMDDVERLMRGDLGPGAGRPLDIAALRNHLESVPIELTALRRDLARLEADG